jgi:hypothetical protein
MSSTKDSEEVVRFMAQFQKLRDWIDDDPDGLEALAATDPAVEKLCDDLSTLSINVSISDRDQQQLFAAPVDAQFIKAWRDYEDRYELKIARIALYSLTGSFAVQQQMPQFDFLWERAEEYAKEQVQAIQATIDFATDWVIHNWSHHDDVTPSFYDTIETGYRAWDRYFSPTAYDLIGILRRRELLPFVLIPRHVSQQHGTSEKLSLYTHPQQAQEAFIFGIHYGALGLMRSILEMVLRDHYRASGAKLKELINTCDSLPKSANKAALHRLRDFANVVLHTNGKTARLPADIEKEIQSLLFVLRALIEYAPSGNHQSSGRSRGRT